MRRRSVQVDAEKGDWTATDFLPLISLHTFDLILAFYRIRVRVRTYLRSTYCTLSDFGFEFELAGKLQYLPALPEL